MTRACIPNGLYEPFTGDQLSILAVARAKFTETCTWAYYIGRMNPERFAQQRAYDRERQKSYREEHKESIAQYSKSWRSKDKGNFLRNMPMSCAAFVTE